MYVCNHVHTLIVQINMFKPNIYAKDGQTQLDCLCRPRCLPNIFDKLSRYRRENVTKSLLVCWHLSKMLDATDTLSLLQALQKKESYINKESVTKFL